MERLQKIIAMKGYCSRRKAEELIQKGKVRVNGQLVTTMGYKASVNDFIEVEGNPLDDVEEKGRKTVVDLINTKKRIYPVGRLDYDTTGLIILTNDGELTNYLIHPKNNIEKVYVAKIEGIITKENLKRLCNGVRIDGYKTSKAKAKILKVDKNKNSSVIELIIHEGKNHQVKKMLVIKF